MIYDLLAPVYDAINRDVDYRKWADFIETILEREYKTRPAELILDLAAGTGRMTLELASRGYDMTAVDISPEMLDIGRRNAQASGIDGILWLCQDMRGFELYGTVDAVVCCLDSINHLTSSADVRQCMRLVHNYLYPGGIFVFDINGKGKFERVYADRSYVFEEEGSLCVWENFYDERKRICDFYITLFKEEEDGRYSRYDEFQCERMYTLRSLKRMLDESGFELIGAYSDFDFTAATDEDERIYVVSRCIKEV